MKLRNTDWWDIALAVIVLAVVGLCYGALSSFAGATPVCRVQKVVKPLVAGYEVPLISYRVAAPLREEAVDTLQFRQSDEYIELQQLRGFKAGVEAVTASGDRPSSPAGLATKGGDNPAGAEQPPAEPSGNEKWDAFRARYPLTAAKCAGCHGRKNPDKPDGDLFLNGDMTLEGSDGELRRFHMLTKVYNGHMPPKNPLTDEEYSAFQAELLSEE